MTSEDSLAPDSTQALLARHRAGDAEALRILVERYYPRLERIVCIRLGSTLASRETVQDVVQDVLVRVIEGLGGYEPRVDAKWIDWVARLAQNEIANHARRNRAWKRGGRLVELVRRFADSAVAFDVPADTTDVSDKVARHETAALVDRCLSSLSAPHREVILLRDYVGSDWRTIAETMGRPSAEACQELYRRARAELALKLHRAG